MPDLPFAVAEDSTLHELEEADQAHDRDLDAQTFTRPHPWPFVPRTPRQRGSFLVSRPVLGNGPGGERGDLDARNRQEST